MNTLRILYGIVIVCAALLFVKMTSYPFGGNGKKKNKIINEN